MEKHLHYKLMIKPAAVAATIMLALTAFTPSTHAQTWDRGATTNNWGDALNWSGDAVPAPGADVIFGTTGAGTIDLGGVTRTLTNVTIQNDGFIFQNGVFDFSGVFSHTTNNGTLRLNDNVSLTGAGSVSLTGNLTFGDFGLLTASGGNTYTGGTVISSGATATLAYGSFTGNNVQIFGSGAVQIGTGVNFTAGGTIAYNATGSSRLTIANNVVNAITRADNFGTNAFNVIYDGGVGAAVASTTRFTGDFSTAAFSGGATGHGWMTMRGRDITNGTRQFSGATYEFSGDWSGYNATSSRILFSQAAFVINSTNSVAGATGGVEYHLNSNNAGAQSTVLALGVNSVNFARNINVENAATGGSNLAGAINQTYIGGRQAGTAEYSGNIAFARAGDHRLNLFSEDGRTEFSGNINAGAGQVVAINSNYTMTTYTSVNAGGATIGNFLIAMTPDGMVAFTGGTKTFSGGLEVTAGTLLINQSITGNVNVASGAVLGTDGGTGVITGDLTLATGALLAFNPSLSLDLTGTFTLNNSFGVGSLRNTTGGAIDWSLIGDNTYTLLTGATFTPGYFSASNISNFGLANAFDIGDGRSAYFENGSLALTVVPEPGTWALVAFSLTAMVVLCRRRRVA